MNQQNSNRPSILVPGLHLSSLSSLVVHLSWAVFIAFGRGYRLSNRILWSLMREREIITKIGQDSYFEFSSSDYYWNKLLLNSYEYEKEIFELLRKLEHIDTLFLDCGANLGYWSILASSTDFGSKTSLAIEPGTEAFEKLSKNRRLNNDRFMIRKKAIYKEPGLLMKFSVVGHPSARHIAEDSANYEEVETTTIDAEVEAVQDSRSLIIKLDVEGAEIAALEGASVALAGDTLVIYEDHGADPLSKVSDYILNTLGMKIFYYSAGGGFERAESLREIGALKANRFQGYNFFACHELTTFFDVLSGT